MATGAEGGDPLYPGGGNCRPGHGQPRAGKPRVTVHRVSTQSGTGRSAGIAAPRAAARPVVRRPSQALVCAWYTRHAAALAQLDRPDSALQRQRAAAHVAPLHHLLGASPDYRLALDGCTERPHRRPGWDWDPLAELAHVHAGLLTVHPGDPVPLHDHPGSRGVQMVVAGRIRVTQYRRERPPGATGDTYILHPLARFDLRRGEAAFFTPVADVHGLAARGERCVILNLLLDPYPAGSRGWYFPHADRPADTPLLATRWHPAFPALRRVSGDDAHMTGAET